MIKLFKNTAKIIFSFTLAIFMVSGLFYYFNSFSSAIIAYATPTIHNVSGYVWSDNIGWVSLNCADQSSCAGVDYGLDIDSNGNISGYGWSENLGWLKFGSLSDFPVVSGTVLSNAKYNATTTMIDGWGRFCAGTVSGDCISASRTDGWGGWLSLGGNVNSISYGAFASTTLQATTTPGASARLSGFAWGSDVVGWVDWSYATFKTNFDYTATSTPLNVTVGINSNVNANITLNKTSGISEYVSIDTKQFSGLPVGVEATSTLPSVCLPNASCFIPITFITKSNAVAGTYNIFATTTSSLTGLQKGFNFNLTISPIAPTPVGLTLACAVNPSVITFASGQNAIWSVSATGGAGNYIYLWTGDEIPSTGNNGSSISINYTTPGFKSATVTVTSGSETKTCVQLNALNVNYFDYSLNNGGNININPGQVATTTLSATLISGIPEDINFAFYNVPAGVSFKLGTTTCTLSCNTTFFASTTANVLPGNYQILIVGTSTISHKVKTTTVNLNISAATVTKGSITVCKIILDENNVPALNGNNLPQATFDLPISLSTSTQATLIDTVHYNSNTFTPNRSVFGSSQDAQCITVSNLSLGDYYYANEVVNTATNNRWSNNVLYSDSETQPVNSVNDTFNYSPELWISTTSQAIASRNVNSDGLVSLSSIRPDRTIVLVNRYSSTPNCAVPHITSATSTQNVNVNNPFSYTFTYSTSQATTSIPAISILPVGANSWATFSPVTNILSGTPTTTGIYPFNVTIANPCASDSATFNVVVGTPALPPVITLVGSSTINLLIGQTFVDQGATAIDPKDGNITSKITVVSPVSTTTPALFEGTFTITYSVTNSSGLTSTVTRTVIVSACETITNSVFSDATTTIEGDGNAVGVATSSVWTANIPGASWIWKGNSPSPTTTDEQIVFNRTFVVDGVATSSQLMIAGDDFYDVWINGTSVASTTVGDNWTLANQKTVNVLPYITTGNNTIRIFATNIASSTASTTDSNPRGVLYRLDTVSKKCPLSCKTLVTSPLSVTATLNTPFTYNLTGITNSTTTTAIDFNVSTSSLPTWLNFATTTTSAVLSGTPTATTSTPILVPISAGNICGVDQKTLSINVVAPICLVPEITSNLAVSTVVGSAFNYTIVASSTSANTQPLNISVATTSLPIGLSFATTTNTISGTVGGSANTYTVPVTITTACGSTLNSNLVITVNAFICALPTITSSMTASATTGQSFTFNIIATSTVATSTAPTLSFATTTLPAWLHVATSTTGFTVSGTAPSAGTYNVNLSAVNSCGTDSKTFAITVTDPTPVTPPTPVASSGGGGGGNGPVYQTLLINNQKISEVTPGVVFLQWDTNLSASRRVVYGTTSIKNLGGDNNYGYASTTLYIDNPLMTSHAMAVFGLQQGVTYYFRPLSTSGSLASTGAEMSYMIATTTIPVVPQEPVKECSYLIDYLKLGANNNPVEVRKLQAFLKDIEGIKDISVNGIFDTATYNAVKTFQQSYLSEIISPWGADTPSGFVYILTKKKVNEIYCKVAINLTPDQMETIAKFKALTASLQSAGFSNSDIQNFTNPIKNQPATTTTGEPVENLIKTGEKIGVSTSTNNGSVLAIIASTTVGALNGVGVNASNTIAQMPKINTGINFGNFFASSTKQIGSLANTAAEVLGIKFNKDSIFGLFYFVLSFIISLFLAVLYGIYEAKKNISKKELNLRRIVCFIFLAIVATVGAIVFNFVISIIPLLAVIIIALGLLAFEAGRKDDDNNDISSLRTTVFGDDFTEKIEDNKNSFDPTIIMPHSKNEVHDISLADLTQKISIDKDVLDSITDKDIEDITVANLNSEEKNK